MAPTVARPMWPSLTGARDLAHQITTALAKATLLVALVAVVTIPQLQCQHLLQFLDLDRDTAVVAVARRSIAVAVKVLQLHRLRLQALPLLPQLQLLRLQLHSPRQVRIRHHSLRHAALHLQRQAALHI